MGTTGLFVGSDEVGVEVVGEFVAVTGLSVGLNEGEFVGVTGLLVGVIGLLVGVTGLSVGVIGLLVGVTGLSVGGGGGEPS